MKYSLGMVSRRRDYLYPWMKKNVLVQNSKIFKGTDMVISQKGNQMIQQKNK